MMRSWITSKLSKKTVFAPLAPDKPFYAIGDIHGRLDLLIQLLDLFDPEIPVFCLGDYVDRGKYSAGVLQFLHEAPSITCLKGNHESMLLDFLYGPSSVGHNWLRNGGMATLASFGVSGLTERSDSPDLEQASMALRSAMGDDLIDWLLALPLFHQTGNVALIHAGADPRVAISDQREETLIWGHPNFVKIPRTDDVWVVHGHNVVDTPKIANGRISIDTGAYATDQLTAAYVAPGGVRFLST